MSEKAAGKKNRKASSKKVPSSHTSVDKKSANAKVKSPKVKSSKPASGGDVPKDNSKTKGVKKKKI
jgi:hypothetical protein